MFVTPANGLMGHVAYVNTGGRFVLRLLGAKGAEQKKLQREIMKDSDAKFLSWAMGAIVNWNRVCKMTHGKDPATYDVAKDILREEIEHEAWFLELLYSRPSGHMRRKFPGERPHTHKHSRALG